MEENKEIIIPSKVAELKNMDKAQIQEIRNYLIKRAGVLKGTAGDINKEVNKYFREEISDITSMLDKLELFEREPNQMNNPSYIEAYENAFWKYINIHSYNKENLGNLDEYITEKHEWPDTNKFLEGIKNANNKEELNKITAEIKVLQRNGPYPDEVRQALVEALDNGLLKIERIEEENRKAPQNTMVSSSKFAEIYGKTKGKMQEVFSKIKAFFRGKSQDKVNETESKDVEENEK